MAVRPSRLCLLALPLLGFLLMSYLHTPTEEIHKVHSPLRLGRKPFPPPFQIVALVTPVPAAPHPEAPINPPKPIDTDVSSSIPAVDSAKTFQGTQQSPPSVFPQPPSGGAVLQQVKRCFRIFSKLFPQNISPFASVFPSSTSVATVAIYTLRFLPWRRSSPLFTLHIRLHTPGLLPCPP